MERGRAVARDIRRLSRQDHKRNRVGSLRYNGTIYRRVRNHPTQIHRLVQKAGAHSGPPAAAWIARFTEQTRLGTATSAIDLGTPLDVETQLTLHLPAGTVVRTPPGTSIVRDYAIFASKYQASSGAVTASRHLNFLLREISADRAADYTAFVRAVQNDEAQELTLERAGAEPPKQATPAAASAGKN